MKTVFKMEEGNKHSVAKKNTQIFKDRKASDFFVKKESKDSYYTVVSELLKFDTQTGKRVSIPQIQTLSPQDFQQMQEVDFFKGKEFEILHDPTIQEEQPKEEPKK